MSLAIHERATVKVAHVTKYTSGNMNIQLKIQLFGAVKIYWLRYWANINEYDLESPWGLVGRITIILPDKVVEDIANWKEKKVKTASKLQKVAGAFNWMRGFTLQQLRIVQAAAPCLSKETADKLASINAQITELKAEMKKDYESYANKVKAESKGGK